MQIIVNADEHETRIALLEKDAVSELYIERHTELGIVGNIYKGRVLKVLPGMQAAFVDIGLEKAGFLYVADVDVHEIQNGYESLFPSEADEDIPRGRALAVEPHEPDSPAARFPIEELLQEGQGILVQAAKSPMGTKGARLTTFITLPGRHLVFMPHSTHVGISRRIEDEAERERLRDLIEALKGPDEGYIIRTVGAGVDPAAFRADMIFLKKLWGTIKERFDAAQAPSLIHHDLSLVLRIIRDLFTDDVSRVVIDSPEEYHESVEFVRTFLPHLEDRLSLYEGAEPIFDHYGIEMEVSRTLGRRVWLKSGGYLVIDHTEALVVIDVNTGKFVGKHHPEDTILTTNLEAVKEIVYQLRLRNMGGIIIIDFIDMEREESRLRVMAALEQALKADRSRTHIVGMSELGLVEMTRKRTRESLAHTLCEPCSYCEGKGLIKSAETVCFEIFREINRLAAQPLTGRKLVLTVHPKVAELFFNEEAASLEHLEKALGKRIVIKADY
ncbi:MAG: ribonuclease E/G, partial [Candidatus Tectimicrobiota bacterium]